MSATGRRSPELDPHPGALPGNGRLVIAFSGGADSTALAHLIKIEQPGRDVCCVHIDHRLDEGSADRADRARDIASRLSLPFSLETVHVDRGRNEEAAARHARYAALRRHVADGDCLLTAHHADDQVETILLRVFRGAGPGGLAGIPRQRRFAGGWLVRPLLAWTRAELQAYCRRQGLSWIEDPTNASLSADRNFLRHRILPELKSRWPGVDQSILRAGALSGRMSDSMTRRLRAVLRDGLEAPNCLAADAFLKLSDLERGELIRRWTQDQLKATPPGKPLDEFLRQIRQASGDQTPALRWDSGRIRFWNRRLWLDRGGAPRPYALEWLSTSPLALPDGLGTLLLAGPSGSPARRLRVRSGRSGDRMRHAREGSTKRVKELLRVHGVPPWQRSRWPRVCDGERLLALGARWIDPDFTAWLDDHCLELQWLGLDSAPDSMHGHERDEQENDER